MTSPSPAPGPSAGPTTPGAAPRSPCLVLVGGHPASGKSTVAALIAARFGLPVLAKDDVQEALFDAGLRHEQGTGDAANRALLRVARRVLASAGHCIVDSNLEPARWRAEVGALLAASGASLLQVCCHAPGEELLERFLARAGSRHPGHRDAQRAVGLRARLLGPPMSPMDLPGVVLPVDTGSAAPPPGEALLAAVARVLRGAAADAR